jgi:hypothetical protein
MPCRACRESSERNSSWALRISNLRASQIVIECVETVFGSYEEMQAISAFSASFCAGC